MKLNYSLLILTLMVSKCAQALVPEIACAIALKKVKQHYTWKRGENLAPHLEIINAFQKFLRKEKLSEIDQEMIDLYSIGPFLDYWEKQPRIKQKFRYWFELFLANQAKDFSQNKDAYKVAIADLNRLDKSGLLASLFVARHPIFVAYLAFFLGPYGSNALYTDTMNEEEAEEFLKAPVPDDQIEYVFYPKHVAMRVRDQYFDVGNRKPLVIEVNPHRPRLDGATFVRVQGDPGLAERVLKRVRNYPAGVNSVYQEWNSTCINAANDLMADETGLCVPPPIAAYPSGTEGWLKMMKLLGSARITQIRSVAPELKLRAEQGHKTKTSWLYRTSKYSAEIAPFLGELAILDFFHDAAEVNFPKSPPLGK